MASSVSVPDKLPLIDGDILLYELGAAAEWPKEEPVKNFGFIVELLDHKIWQIQEKVETGREPLIFTTKGGNYRHDIATIRPYKGNRKAVVKPFHYRNLLVYFASRYQHKHVWGMEADDAMGIYQCAVAKETGSYDSTIICSRDKDLKQIPGWHFSWECGRQPEQGPLYVQDPGEVDLKGSKLTGNGLSFFWSQMLMGDGTDHIPGLPGWGPKRSFGMLYGKTGAEMKSTVQYLYNMFYGDQGPAMFWEQARLLWICRDPEDAQGNIERWWV